MWRLWGRVEARRQQMSLFTKFCDVMQGQQDMVFTWCLIGAHLVFTWCSRDTQGNNPAWLLFCTTDERLKLRSVAHNTGANCMNEAPPQYTRAHDLPCAQQCIHSFLSGKLIFFNRNLRKHYYLVIFILTYYVLNTCSHTRLFQILALLFSTSIFDNLFTSFQEIFSQISQNFIYIFVQRRFYVHEFKL
jgi:hypothetical protein